MSVYHIRFEADEDWYVMQAVEDEKIHSQARTLDEAVLMIRDVLDLLKGEKDAELRLIIPANLPVDDLRQSGRITDALTPEDEADAIVPRAADSTAPPTDPRKASA